MLKITIPSQEIFDDKKSEFIYVDEKTIQLEHSLISVSKWEARWKKAFLGNAEKTIDETIDYIRCMSITPNVDPEIFNYMTGDNIKMVQEYINDPMTATHFLDEAYPEKPARVQQDVITSELIYYWMISLQIPFECQKWHLSRLLTLIKVCGKKNEAMYNSQKGKGRRAPNQQVVDRAAINAKGKAQLNTTG